MNRTSLSLIAGVGLSLLAHHVSAQSPAGKPKAPLNNAASGDKSGAKAEDDRFARERRTKARSLLISLASEAYSFQDQMLRARSLARIADALWDADPEQGRTLFRKAWEVADSADKNQGDVKPGHEPLNLRKEVLVQAARRDRLLADEFLRKLKADEQEPKAEPSENKRSWEYKWQALPVASERQLSMASEMLSLGDVKRALQLAGPLLGNVTISTLVFLTKLREKDPAAADQRYAAILASAGGNSQADANTISLLASYLFTPSTYVIFDEGGSYSSTTTPTLPPANVDPQLRIAFFQTAVSVLQRTQPSEQDREEAGISDTYTVIKRLMPLFEQYAPQELTAIMRGQFEALNSMVREGIRQSDNQLVQKGIIPEKQAPAEQENSLLDQIEHAGTSKARDELYFRLALLALGKDDMKARDYVNKIDESEFRKQVQAWVDVGLAGNALRHKKIETTLELARNGELTHIQRLWLLTQTAKLLAKTDHDKALSLLDDATAEARRLEISDLDHPRGLLAIANALTLVEPSRAWEAVFDAVKAANSTNGFTGEDGALTFYVGSQSQGFSRGENIPDFDIDGIFGRLAIDDYDRAAQLARGFQGEAPRTNATLAVALAVLNQKNAPAPRPAAKN